MRKLIFKTILLLSFILISCDKDDDNATYSEFAIKGITLENYPIVDCSTSAEPLQTLIACKLLNYNYEWRRKMEWDGTYTISPTDYKDIYDPDKFRGCLKSSGTHDAFINLIDKKADLILVARKISADELEYANKHGVKLIETPIALDAFIFITNLQNPVGSLTTKQIQDIYTGNVTNWSQVGGNEQKIDPYVRNANSGSQELMESLVMNGLDFAEWPEELTGMMGPFYALRNNTNGICYTVYYYKEQIVKDKIVKHIAVDGIYPDKNTITNRQYPYVTEVYAVVRTDLNKNSMARKIYDCLISESAKDVIEESGYIPMK